MGIRESLLNTITSVADSDFVRVVTSAGTSSKATVKNLFKSFESNLGAKSSLTTSDYIRVVGSDNEAYKQSVSSVKTAMGIDTLNNRTKLNIASGSTVTSLSTFTAWVDSIAPSTGGCLIYVSSTIANNIGLSDSGYYIQVYSSAADWRICVAFVTGGNLIKTLAKPGAWQTTWKGTTLS